MRSSFLRIGEQYPSSGLRPSEGIVHQFFGMMTAFTDTSSPELPYSLIFTQTILAAAPAAIPIRIDPNDI